MRLKSILIANLSEAAIPLAHLMNNKRAKEEIFEDHALCDRFIFSSNDNLLLITPFLVDKIFITGVKKLLKISNIINLSPKKIGESVCDSTLQDKKLLAIIVQKIKNNPKVKIQSYVSSQQFLKLISYLKKLNLQFDTPETPQEKNYKTTSYFDSKSGFRQTAAKVGKGFLPMPKGFICRGIKDVHKSAKYFLGQKKGCVVKTDKGLAGAGLTIIRRQEIKKNNLDFLINHHLTNKEYWLHETTVVEEFIEPDLKICGGAPNIELKIIDDKVTSLYVCGMRISSDGVFKGVEMGKNAVSSFLTKQLLKHGKIFGNYLKQKGYRGYFEIDFVFGKNGKLYPIEANLRRTGGTHVFELGRRLLGKNFLKHYYIVANNIAHAPRLKNKSYDSVKKILKDYLYPIKGKKEGIIITIINYLNKGNIGYVVVGNNSRRVKQIERDFLRLVL